MKTILSEIIFVKNIVFCLIEVSVFQFYFIFEIKFGKKRGVSWTSCVLLQIMETIVMYI